MVNQLPWLSAMKHSRKNSDSSFPIFYDPDGHRWPRVRGAWLALAVLVILLTATLVASVLIDPVLPHMGLRPVSACAPVETILARAFAEPLGAESQRSEVCSADNCASRVSTCPDSACGAGGPQ